MTLPANESRGAFHEFVAGVRVFGRGLSTWSTAPRLMLTGAIPAFIVAIAFLAMLAFLAVNVTAVAEWLTPFARDWSEPVRFAATTLVSVAVVVVAGLALVYTFTAITLLVGDVFYEKIWASIESRFGSVPDANRGFWASLWRSASDSIRILVVTIGASILVVAVGLVPLVGGILVPVLSALVGGWFLAVELTARAFDARGFTLTERRRMLRSRRAFCLGFGVSAYLSFLVPFGAVVAMPAAVVGGTLVARDMLERSGALANRSTDERPGSSTPPVAQTAPGAPNTVRTPGE